MHFQYDVVHIFYGWNVSHCTDVPIMFQNGYHFLFVDDDTTEFSWGVSFKKNYPYQYIDALLFLTVELLHFMNQIIEHARQCHKSIYVKSINCDLLTNKIFIYNYLSIPYGSPRKTHFHMK